LDLARSGIVQPSTGFAGLVSLDAQGSSNGEVVSLNGKLKAEKLKLAKNGSPAPQPVNFDFAVDHDLRKKTGRLKTGNIHFGSAPAALTGTYDLRGETAVLNMAFSGPNMAIDQLKQFLPAMDVVLPSGSSLQGGTASAKLTSQGPSDALVTSGSLGLNNTRLAGFDLGSKMKAVEALAGIPGGPNTDVQTLSADVRMAPQGTAINNFQLVVPTIGQIVGAGTIGPDHTLDFKMGATVHTSGAILASLGQKGDTKIPFLIVGTSSNPTFRPDVKSLAAQKIQQLGGNSDLGKAAGSILNNLFGGKKKK
jgi:AsmA protein